MHRSALSAALIALAIPLSASAQHPELPAAPVEGADFRVYDGKGHARSFADILAALDGADAVLVGEEHDDVVGHGVEAQIFIRAGERFGATDMDAPPKRTVVLSLEMFERDIQYVLDEYLSDLITEDQFLRSSRPWDRYATDYRLMVEFARAHGLPVVAANAPRRYVNRVSRLGAAALDQLPAAARAFLPPLPYPLASEKYTEQWNALMSDMGDDVPAAPDSAGAEPPVSPDSAGAEPPAAPDSAAAERPTRPQHDLSKALEAQALWDAAMGNAVAGALTAHPGALVIHYAGSFHVERETGIPERVPEYRPGTRIVTVVIQPTADVNAWDKEEHEGLADFVVLTYRAAEGNTGG